MMIKTGIKTLRDSNLSAEYLENAIIDLTRLDGIGSTTCSPRFSGAHLP
jgi:hypothetical protein